MPPVSKLERRVVAAAEAALTGRRQVSPLDVLTGMGWVPPGNASSWPPGRASAIDEVLSQWRSPAS